MLTLAFVLLCGAALFGAALAMRHLAGADARKLPAALPPLHGVLGAAGLACLLLALRHGLPASRFGTASFGPIAAVLLGLALVLGLAMAPAAWRRRRPPEPLVGAHAGLAIAGLVMLLTLVALR
jgi:hypothetical protein